MSSDEKPEVCVQFLWTRTESSSDSVLLPVLMNAWLAENPKYRVKLITPLTQSRIAKHNSGIALVVFELAPVMSIPDSTFPSIE